MGVDGFAEVLFKTLPKGEVDRLSEPLRMPVYYIDKSLCPVTLTTPVVSSKPLGFLDASLRSESRLGYGGKSNGTIPLVSLWAGGGWLVIT